MRKLMWFTIGFSAACALCAYLQPDAWMLPLIIASGLLSLGFAFGSKYWKPIRVIAAVLLGCGVGLLWFLAFQRYYLLPAAALDGVTVDTEVTATDYSYETSYGTAMDGRVEIDGKSYQIRVYINEKKSIAPGDRLVGSFRYRLTTANSRDGETYHQGKGIFLLGYERELAQIIRGQQGKSEYYAATLRRQIQDILRACFPKDVFAFVQALLLGDGSELSYETDTAFKISGIRHIIAVSGLHVSILYGLLSVLTFRKRYLTALISIPVLFLFAAVAGFTPSVSRACIMVGLMILAQIFNKEYDSPTALAFACLVMLTVNPLVITSVGFQLSVGCVAGILLFNAPILEWMTNLLGVGNGKGIRGKLKRWFAGSVSVTVSAMSLTTPLSAFYFGTVSLIGVVTNLITLWVVNFIFNGIVVLCVISLISVKFASIMGWILAWPVRYVLAAAKLLASLPLAAVYTQSAYIVAWLVFCYLLLAVFLLSRKKRPVILCCCAAIGLCGALMASWAEPLTDECRVTVLDVGQGQGILLQSEGRTYLVDCGGENDEATADLIAQTLLSQGIHRLDGIIVTHNDRDHAGGLEYLLTQIDTDLLLLSGAVPEEERQEYPCRTIYVQDNMLLTYGDTAVRIYGPLFVSESNENSLCVLFDTENCDILITGDRSSFGERMLLRSGDIPDVDLLIAGHHGSKYSTCEELLQAVTPETVIISAGADNPYGHPAPELLERLAQFGCDVYRTDESGTIIFRR